MVDVFSSCSLPMYCSDVDCGVLCAVVGVGSMSCIFFLMTIMTMHGDMMMLGVWCANGVRMVCEECAKNIIHVEACVGMYVGMLASPV